jgi:hypothetical protein
MNGAICGGFDVLERRIRHCPTENAQRRMVGGFAPWYGWTVYCLGCGDRWQDGERGERPFARGWRSDAIRHAEELYARALSGAAARSALDRAVRESIA